MFTRIPFKVTNGVACFQRIMDTLIKERLEGTFACRAKITICGITQNDVNYTLCQFEEISRGCRE